MVPPMTNNARKWNKSTIREPKSFAEMLMFW
jgi:hypothetical protein